jgi:NAD(P)-dependent dehydrogenase (short-subunit alcohol dehydrogenase family)
VKDRVAVVTGGAKGIGLAIAERLRARGARVVVWDLVAPDDPGYTYTRVDVSAAEQIDAAVAECLGRHAHLDILVNNAGIWGRSSALADYPVDEWRRVIEVDLVAVFLACRAVVPHMVRAGYGRIVNIASLAGKEGTANASAYSAAKAGVIALTKSLGKELAETGVLVNAIAPAAIRTDLLAQIAPETLAAMLARSPMKRLGTVDEAASLVAWLASEDCTFNTGAVFDLSGGRATY